MEWQISTPFIENEYFAAPWKWYVVIQCFNILFFNLYHSKFFLKCIIIHWKLIFWHTHLWRINKPCMWMAKVWGTTRNFLYVVNYESVFLISCLYVLEVHNIQQATQGVPPELMPIFQLKIILLFPEPTWTHPMQNSGKIPTFFHTFMWGIFCVVKFCIYLWLTSAE